MKTIKLQLGVGLLAMGLLGSFLPFNSVLADAPVSMTKNETGLSDRLQNAYRFVDANHLVLYQKFPAINRLGHVVNQESPTVSQKKLKDQYELMGTNDFYHIVAKKTVLVTAGPHKHYTVEYDKIISNDQRFSGWTLSTNLTWVLVFDQLVGYKTDVLMEVKPNQRKVNHFYNLPAGFAKNAIHPLKLSKKLNQSHFTIRMGVLRVLEDDTYYQVRSDNKQIDGKWISGGAIQTVDPHQNAGVFYFYGN